MLVSKQDHEFFKINKISVSVEESHDLGVKAFIATFPFKDAETGEIVEIIKGAPDFDERQSEIFHNLRCDCEILLRHYQGSTIH